MEMNEQTRYCQSCAMPLAQEEHFGTEADGSKNEDYCIYCYEKGAFTQPDATLEGMIETCIPFMVQNGMSETESRAILQDVLPRSKRWAS